MLVTGSFWRMPDQTPGGEGVVEHLTEVVQHLPLSSRPKSHLKSQSQIRRVDKTWKNETILGAL